jgi:hypothetical protein
MMNLTRKHARFVAALQRYGALRDARAPLEALTRAWGWVLLWDAARCAR